MYKNTICSLSLLYANYSSGRGDYIETFVPFIATLIFKKQYSLINVTDISKDFCDEYGLYIDYHPMVTILTRCKKRKIIQKISGQYKPIYNEIEKYEFSKIALSEHRNQEKLITKITEFAKDRHNYEMSKTVAEEALICFLKEYDLEIIFASEEKSLLPEVSTNTKDKFIIHSFIKNAYESDDEQFQCIVKASIGHLIANSILYKEFDRYRGKLKNVCLYFDTKLIFRFLGFEGDERKQIYIDFFNILRREGAKFYLFKHTYDEIEHILYDSINWVKNPNYYDPSKANSITRFFIENNRNELDVQRYINNLKINLQEIGIDKEKIVEKPDQTIDTLFNIDELKLYDIIIDTYKSNSNFDEYEKEYTIHKDVDSIAAIYKLRGKSKPRVIKDANHVFVTTNGALAYSAKNYELLVTNDSFYLPACLTDVFIGTILWLQSPAKIMDINNRQIIAQCYAALKPDTRLLSIFIHKVDELKSEGKITENDYYMLRTSQVAHSLLEDKTLGDAANFTNKLLFEILEEMEGFIRKEEEKKYQNEKISHEKTRKDLHIYKEYDITFTYRANQISNIISIIFTCCLLILGGWGLIASVYPVFTETSQKINWIPVIIYSIISLCSFCILIIKKLRLKVKNYLFKKVVKIFLGKNDI